MAKITGEKGLPAVVRKIGIAWIDNLEAIKTHVPGTDTFTSERIERTAAETAGAIKDMVVRGAPAIGITAAYGMAMAQRRGESMEEAYTVLAASRPTAVNLKWALDRVSQDICIQYIFGSVKSSRNANLRSFGLNFV